LSSILLNVPSQTHHAQLKISHSSNAPDTVPIPPWDDVHEFFEFAESASSVALEGRAMDGVFMMGVRVPCGL
jgi:hypothetical protein